jgi:hypothetical protein
VAFFEGFDSAANTVTIGIAKGWTLSQGWAQSGTQCFEPTPVATALVAIGERWAFTAPQGESFVAELLVSPAA